MASFLATLSAAAASNWAICKRHRLWGTGTSANAKAAAQQVRPGDELFVWQSGLGLIAEARVATPSRAVTNIGEVPWPDPERYSFVFGIDVQREIIEPIADRFKDQRSVRFGIRIHQVQNGLSPIDEDVAFALRSALDEAAPASAQDERAPQIGEDTTLTVNPVRDQRWARPMAGVYLRPAATVTEVLLALYRRVADDDDGEMMVIGDERDRELVERELTLEPFVDIRDRVRFVTGDELAAELQRRLPRM
jgi:hypothetical protein